MIQDTRTYSIVYRPRFKKPGRWFAWVRVPGQRDLKYWPVSEREAMEWYDNNLPLLNGRNYRMVYALPESLQ